MKLVFSFEFSPKLLGTLDPEAFEKMLEKRFKSFIKSQETKWRKENDDLLNGQCEDVEEIDWSELVQEGFKETRESLDIRIWG